ncbi:uncharacterized protein LOC134844579 isoform X3 [Symsagittifera roscoffensis]|uniref:uncharacterized protein LOC134844579 isoform X3 n=1 Tax=Symsagittifera roscoffensis TaxID=84072 RepID=UPI00307B8C88
MLLRTKLGRESDVYVIICLLLCKANICSTSSGADDNGDSLLPVRALTSVQFDRSSIWLGERAEFQCIISMNIFMSDYDFYVRWPYGIWSTELPEEAQPSNIYNIINETHRLMGKIVFQATYRDDGEYVCSAVTDDTPVRSQTIKRRLTILSSTKSLTMTPASGTQITTSEGATDNVEVSCLAELANPAAEITWSLNGKSVELDPRFTIADPIIQDSPNSNDPRKSTESRVSLSAAAVTMDLHMQDLSCHAKSEADVTARNSTVRFNVLYGPRVSLKVSPTLIHPQHRSIAVDCQVDANPAPSPQQYRWTLDGGDEGLSVASSTFTQSDADNTDAQRNTQQQHTNSILVDVDSSMENKELKCQVSTVIGGKTFTDSASLLLHFAQPPQFISELPSEKVVKEGDSFELVCEAEGEPTPSVEWIRNGVREVSGSVLSIQRAEKSHNGEYTCRVYSEGFEPITGTTRVQIYGAPVILMDAKVEVVLGDSAVLRCDVDASVVTPGLVSWKRSNGHDGGAGHTMPEGNFQKYSVERIEHDHFVSMVLTVFQVGPDDLGQYNCTAYNDAGITSKVILLQEQGAIMLNGEEGFLSSQLVMIVSIGAVSLVLVSLLTFCVTCLCYRARNKDASSKAPPYKVEVRPNSTHQDVDHLKMSHNSLDCSQTTPPCHSHSNSVNTIPYNGNQTSLDRMFVHGTQFQQHRGSVPMNIGGHPGTLSDNMSPSSTAAFLAAAAAASNNQRMFASQEEYERNCLNEELYKHQLHHQSQQRLAQGGGMMVGGGGVGGGVSSNQQQLIQVVNHRNSLPPISASAALHSQMHKLSNQQIHIDPDSQSVQYSTLGHTSGANMHVPSHHVIPSDQIDSSSHLGMYFSGQAARGNPMALGSHGMQYIPRSTTLDAIGDGSYAFIGSGGNPNGSNSDRSLTSEEMSKHLIRVHGPLEIDSGLGSSIQESPPIAATTTLLQLANKQEQQSYAVTSSACPPTSGFLSYKEPSPSVSLGSHSSLAQARRPLKPPPYDLNQPSPVSFMGSLGRGVKPSASLDHISGSSKSSNGLNSGNIPLALREKPPAVSTFKPKGQMGASNRSLNRVDEVFDPSTDILPGVTKGVSNSGPFQSDTTPVHMSRVYHQSPPAGFQCEADNNQQASDSGVVSHSQAVRKPNKTFVAQNRPVSYASTGALHRGRQSSDSSEVSESAVRNPNERAALSNATLSSLGHRRKSSMKNKVRFCDEETSYPTDADVEDSDFSDISSSYSQQSSIPVHITASQNSRRYNIEKSSNQHSVSSSPNNSFALV